jgi:hypothetical protein
LSNQLDIKKKELEDEHNLLIKKEEDFKKSIQINEEIYRGTKKDLEI